MGLDPEALFTLKGGRDDKGMGVGKVAVDTQGLKGDTMLEKGKGNHGIKLCDKRLS